MLRRSAMVSTMCQELVFCYTAFIEEAGYSKQRIKVADHVQKRMLSAMLLQDGLMWPERMPTDCLAMDVEQLLHQEQGPRASLQRTEMKRRCTTV